MTLSVLAVIDRIDYTTWWRVLWPFSELRRHGYKADVVMYADVRKLDISSYDIIITPRVTFGGDHWLFDWLKNIQKQGKTWIYEADDNLWDKEFIDRQVEREQDPLSRSERHNLHAMYERQRKQRISILKHCDGITVSTQPLADQVGQLTKTPVIVVPNMIDARQFELDLERHERMVPTLTVGWTGGERREADLEPLGEAWAEIARRYPEVTFVVYGHEPDLLMDSVPVNRLAVVEWVPIKMYPAGLKNIDIGCCVLPDTPWNQSKSANKWMELSLAGAACVVSPTVYGQTVESGYSALVADTADDWIVHIENLIINPVMRARIGFNARVEIRTKHNLQIGWEKWPNAWLQLARGKVVASV